MEKDNELLDMRKNAQGEQIYETAGDAVRAKQDKLEFNTPYDAITNKVATMADILNVI